MEGIINYCGYSTFYSELNVKPLHDYDLKSDLV